MAVTVDIPGVGSVQATNAAENSTLQAILSAIQYNKVLISVRLVLNN